MRHLRFFLENFSIYCLFFLYFQYISQYYSFVHIKTEDMTEILKNGKYSALTIANEFILRAKKDGAKLTRQKLHTLIYLSHARHLVLHERPLIYEAIEAWKYDPIILELYRVLKAIPSTTIESCIVGAQPQEVDPRDLEIVEIINNIWASYETYAYIDLLPALQEPKQKRSNGFSSFNKKSPVVADWLIRSHFSEVFA